MVHRIFLSLCKLWILASSVSAQEMPPLFTAHSQTDLSVRKGSILKLEVMTNDKDANITWRMEKKEVCYGFLCDIKTGRISGESIKIHVLAINTYGSEGIIFNISFQGDPLVTPQDVQPELIRANRPNYFPPGGTIEIQAIKGNGWYELNNRPMAFGLLPRKIPIQGLLTTSENNLLRLNLPQGSSSIMMPNSVLILEKSSKERIKLGLKKGTIRLIKPISSPDQKKTKTMQFLRISNWLKIISRKNGDVLVTREKDKRRVSLLVLAGEIEIWNRADSENKQSFKEKLPNSQSGNSSVPTEKIETNQKNLMTNQSPPKKTTKTMTKSWQRKRYHQGYHIIISKNGEINEVYTPTIRPDSIQPKVTEKIVYKAPPPVPPSYKDLVILARALRNPDDLREDISHPFQEEKLTHQGNKKEEKSFIYRGLEYIDPINDIVDQLASRILDDSFSTQLGMINYQTSGRFTEKGISFPSLLLITDHYFGQSYSIGYGLHAGYHSGWRRLQYLAGDVHFRYFIWGSHPKGLGRVDGIDYLYEGWRPYLEMGTKIGKFIIKQGVSKTQVVSADFIGLTLGSGSYFHISKALAIDTQITLEVGNGIGPMRFSNVNISLLTGPVFYF